MSKNRNLSRVASAQPGHVQADSATFTDTVTASAFIGSGAQLTGITSYDSAKVQGQFDSAFPSAFDTRFALQDTHDSVAVQAQFDSAFPSAFDTRFALQDTHDSVAVQAQIDSAAVTLTGNQTVAGIKTFSDSAVFSSNVGIGTTSPASLLEVSSATGTTPTSPSEVRISTSTNGSNWSQTAPWGQLSFYSADISYGGAKVQAAVAATADASNGALTRLGFFLSPAGGSLTEYMSVTHYGNVGIGTTSPSDLLTLATTATGDDTVIRFDQNGNDWELRASGSTGTVANSFSIYDGNAATERVVIKNDGNVGIGTTTPNGPLHVQASTAELNINADSNLSDRIAPLVIGNGDDSSDVCILIDGNQIEQAREDNYLYFNYNSNAGTVINYGGGDVGIGIAPSGWASSLTAMQFSNGALWSTSGANNASIGSNLYYDASVQGRTISTARSTQYQQFDGSHRWYEAGSVTAGSLVNGTGNMTERMRLTEAGVLHVDDNIVAYSTTVSDIRLKENVEVVEGAVDKIQQLRGVTFDRKDTGKRSAGIIAQEVEEVLPEAITEMELPLKEGFDEVYKTVEYDALHALLIEAIKELKAEIDELKSV